MLTHAAWLVFLFLFFCQLSPHIDTMVSCLYLTKRQVQMCLALLSQSKPSLSICFIQYALLQYNIVHRSGCPLAFPGFFFFFVLSSIFCVLFHRNTHSSAHMLIAYTCYSLTAPYMNSSVCIVLFQIVLCSPGLLLLSLPV